MIFLYGAYGAGNLGDDAILKSALEKYGRSNSRVISYGKPALRDPIDYIDHFQFIEQPAKFLSAGDTLIFAGGGLFWAASHAEVMRDCAFKAKELGCDIQAEKLGAQGIHVAVEAARNLFNLCSRISVRDHESVALLKQLNVTSRAIYEPDFVLCLKDLPPRKIQSDRIVVGISHSAVPFYYDESHRKKTLHIYTEIVKRCEIFADFIYIPHTRHYNVIAQNDVIFGEYFWKDSGGRIKSLPFPDTVETLLEYYSATDGVFAWRYHALVMAHILGARAAFLGERGGHKYGAFAREHKLPQIDFRLEVVDIIASGVRFVNSLKGARKLSAS